MSTRSDRAAVALFVVALLHAPAVRAQGVGFIGGGTIDPEQWYVGTFFETPQLAQNVRLRPGVDGSWGGGLRIASINIDVIYRTDVPSGWQLYTGLGPNILLIRPDDAPGVPADTDVSGGIGGVFGFAHSSGFLTEFRVGRSRNGPNLKLGAGFKIGGRPSTSP